MERYILGFVWIPFVWTVFFWSVLQSRSKHDALRIKKTEITGHKLLEKLLFIDLGKGEYFSIFGLVAYFLLYFPILIATLIVMLLVVFKFPTADIIFDYYVRYGLGLVAWALLITQAPILIYELIYWVRHDLPETLKKIKRWFNETFSRNNRSSQKKDQTRSVKAEKAGKDQMPCSKERWIFAVILFMGLGVLGVALLAFPNIHKVLLGFGAAVVLTGAFGVIFTRTVKENCRPFTTALAVGISAGLGFMFYSIWAKCNSLPLFGIIDNPYENMIVVSAFFAVFMLFLIYLSEKKPHMTLRGMLIDAGLTVSYLYFWFEFFALISNK